MDGEVVDPLLVLSVEVDCLHSGLESLNLLSESLSGSEGTHSFPKAWSRHCGDPASSSAIS